MRGMKTGLQRYIEDVFGEPLERLLARWYEQGLSPYQVAALIRQRGIVVSGQTVLNWTRSLGGRRVLRNEKPGWRMPEPA